jgi:hypothetical protein
MLKTKDYGYIYLDRQMSVENKIWDLERLMRELENFIKVSRIDLKSNNFITEGTPIRRVLSTNWRWVRGLEVGEMEIPFKELEAQVDLINIPIPSSTMIYRKGDMDSP